MNRSVSCNSDMATRFTFSSWVTVYLLLLPLFLLVLYISFNKRRGPRGSASGRGLSHSDVFTLHMMAMELICIIGSFIFCFGFFNSEKNATAIGKSTIIITSTGQVLFHSLTCVERYLAVVYPVAYMRLRGGGGVTVRNVCITIVWFFTLFYTVLFKLIECNAFHLLLKFLLSIATMPCVAYCCVYVLCTLMRPKPGDRSGHRKHQSNRSTVYTMAAILGALLLRLVPDMVYNISFLVDPLHLNSCLLGYLSLWFTLPSSLVLPLLFLQKVGKVSRK